MECFLCRGNENLLIKAYRYWTVLIHPNQCYLGRCMVKLNRHVVDLFDTTHEERNELFLIVTMLRDALREIFKPDLLNYSSAGNLVEHLHLHVIPRYKFKRVYEGAEFTDENWGKNYATSREHEVPGEVMKKMISEIRQRI